jgi:hypothetical protein
MHILKLSVRDTAEVHPRGVVKLIETNDHRAIEGCLVKFVELSTATNDDEAIKLGSAQIARQIPAGYTLIKARVCRDEEVIWSAFTVDSSRRVSS